MKHTFLLILAAVILTGCEMNKDKPLSAQSEIRQVLKAQQDAWNRGDISAFMDSYLESEALSFVTSGGLLQGHSELEARYAKSYPDAERMGTLNFDELHFEQLGADHAMLIGHWQLKRDSDMPEGYFTLIWARTEMGWKIIADHTS